MEKLLAISQRILPSNAAEGRMGSIELNLWLAQLVGLPLLGLKQETHLQKLWIILLGVFILFALFWYVVFELYDLCLNWHDLDRMTQNVVLSLTHVVYWLKVFNTYYHYEGLKEIVRKLTAITRSCVLSEEQIETFHKAELKGKFVMLMYFNLVLLPGVLGLIMILLVPEEFAGGRFPYTAQMPDFIPPIVQYIYMGLSVALLALAITTIDCLNVLLMNQICMHLKVLNLAFDQLFLSSDSEKLRVEPYHWLLSIVKYHCEIIVLRQQVERIYSLPVILQFLSSVLIVAMTAFQVIVGDGSKSSIIMDLLLCCVLCQLFLYCWFGNEVYEQSKTLSTSGFGCSWHQFDKRSGGFMGLTLPSFTYIMSKSYSIVAVLRQMYSRT